MPNWISLPWNLKYLLLERNHFEGSISLALRQMTKISMVDLSYYGFLGEVPSCLEHLTFGNGGVSNSTFDMLSENGEHWQLYQYEAKLSLSFLPW